MLFFFLLFLTETVKIDELKILAGTGYIVLMIGPILAVVNINI